MTNSAVLAKLAVLISANTAEFNKALSSSHKQLSSFTSNISKLAGTVALAFGANEVIGFGFEVSKLAGTAEAVTNAFDRLPESTKLMKDLKSATGDTVSELELMKRAVQSSNFDISLKALPELLRFATVRAQQTGQSVDYLVDSIVTGIGRKSKLILDNLGISAVQLNEKLKGVGIGEASVGQVAKAVGEIASEALSKTGDLADNASTKVQRLGASFDNLKVSIGNLLNAAGVPSFFDWLNDRVNQLNEALTKGATTEGLKNYIALFNKMQPGGLQFLQMHEEIEKMAGRLGVKLVALKDEATGTYKVLFDPRTPPNWIDATKDKVAALVITLESLKEKQKGIGEAFQKSSISDTTGMRLLAFENFALSEKIKKLEYINKLVAEDSPGLKKANGSVLTPKKFGLIDMDAVDLYLSSMRRMLTATKETTGAIKAQFLDLSGAVTGALVTVADGLGNAIAGVGNFGETIVRALAGFARQIGESLIAIGVGMLAAKIAIKNPYTAIAAGIALVALSGAMTAGMSRAQNNFNSGSLGGGGSRASFETGRGGSFTGSGSIQDSRPQLVAVLKGQDIWLTLQNYNMNNKYTNG